MKRSTVSKWLFEEDLKNGFERRITGGFWNSDPSYPYKPHAGVDYGADIGERVTAYDDYVVIGINTGHSDYGQHIFLYFPKINKTGLYAHLSKILVSMGQRGSAQSVVALSGNTGKSGGPHLHFGLANGKVTSTDKGKFAGDIWLDYETFNYQASLVNNNSSDDYDHVLQHGIFTATTETGSNIRNKPSTDGERIGGVPAGEEFEYTSYVDNDGYRWVHKDGKYVARRTLDGSQVFGDARFVDEPAKPSVNEYGQAVFVGDSIEFSYIYNRANGGVINKPYFKNSNGRGYGEVTKIHSNSEAPYEITLNGEIIGFVAPVNTY